MGSLDQALQHTLAREIGCHSVGSLERLRYIANSFRAAGLEVEFQELAVPDWTAESTRLELAGEALEAYANTFSPPCDVTAPILATGTLEELESADLSRRIAIFYGDLAKEPLLPKNTFYAGEREQKIIRLLEEKQPAALITVNPTLEGRWRHRDADLKLLRSPSSVGLRLVQIPAR
jgi:aminopeptidase YwaD